jgi:hypothetical protein
VTVTVPEPPILVTIPRVELIDVGTWDISNVDGWHPSTDDLAHAVAALDCPAVRRPVLKLGHVPGPGDPALGFVDNLATTEDGMLLVGDYAGVPSWLASTDTTGATVIASAYPDRSVEGEYGYVCQLGHVHPFVVHAVALLGVERPGVGTLQSLIDLYGEAPAPAADAVTATAAPKEAPVPAQVAAAATTDDVRRAYYAGPGASWDLWIREMYVDPPELIVENDADASLTRVPYTVDGTGTVTFADPQPVKVQYVAARAAADRPVIAWASHSEARPGQRPTPQTPAAPAAGTTEQEGSLAVAFNDEQLTTLRQRLGVAEDADETTILAALDEALNERADAPQEPSTTPQIPDGSVIVEEATLEELRVAASAGLEARNEQLAARREQLVAAAISDGRVPPARREHWLAQLAADAGAESVLASLAPGLVPVDPAKGTPGAGDVTEDDAVFAALFGSDTTKVG